MDDAFCVWGGGGILKAPILFAGIKQKQKNQF